MLLLKNTAMVALVVATAALPLHAGFAATPVLYTPQGNIQQDAQGAYTYNAFNQLISNKVAQYQYYATGMQASEQADSKVLFHYYVGGQLLNSALGAGMSSYLMGKSAVARVYPGASNTLKAQVYVRNVHSSVEGVVQAQSVNAHQYNIYGLPQGDSGAVSLSLSINPWGYSNYYYDTLAHLYYLKARYYSPRLAAFLSRDSANLENRYFYVNGNPVMLTDPTGHNAVSQWFSGAWQSISHQTTYNLAFVGGATGLVVGGAALGLYYYYHSHSKPVIQPVDDSVPSSGASTPVSSSSGSSDGAPELSSPIPDFEGIVEQALLAITVSHGSVYDAFASREAVGKAEAYDHNLNKILSAFDKQTGRYEGEAYFDRIRVNSFFTDAENAALPDITRIIVSSLVFEAGAKASGDTVPMMEQLNNYYFDKDGVPKVVFANSNGRFLSQEHRETHELKLRKIIDISTEVTKLNSNSLGPDRLNDLVDQLGKVFPEYTFR